MRLFLFITIIALFLLIIPSTPSAETFKQFVDREYGYSIKHPSSWKAKIHRSGMVLADINSPDNKSGLQVRITHFQNSLEAFVDRYMQTFKSQMQASFINKAQRKIGHIESCTITFRSNRGGTDYFLKSYILPVKNGSGFYIFQAGTPFETRSRIEPILDSMADSFRLSN